MNSKSLDNLKFHLKKNTITDSQPLLNNGIWSSLPISSKCAEDIQGLPNDLSGIKYISIQISHAPDSFIVGLRGINNVGDKIYYFDRNNDEDFSKELPYSFPNKDSIETLTIPAQYDELIGGKVYPRDILIELYKDNDKVDYHLKNYWECKAILNDDTLRFAIVRYPPINSFMFIDTDHDLIYDKYFNIQSERLTLAGNFYTVQIDLPSEEVTFLKTGQQPVDAGYSAPIFSGRIYNSDRIFDLSKEKGKITILFFSYVDCHGTADLMPSLIKISNNFSNNPNINFISIASDSSEVLKYNNRFDFPFQSIIDKNIWSDYGVISTPSIFIIDKNGVIQQRGMGKSSTAFISKIESLL
jgi:cytochrome oxidase Cu insertion factor (SCO1/SenC/PrrC family)